MQRSQRLSPFSAKRLAELRESGVVPFSTFTGTTNRGAGWTKRPVVRGTGPDNATVQQVWIRDEGRCGWCGRPIDPYGTRSWDWSVQHRRPRRAGGDPRPDTNLPSNLELLHGSGTTLCHGEVEGPQRAKAIRDGHILHADDVPSHHAVEHAVHGWVYLTDDGGWSTTPPPVDRGGVVDLGVYGGDAA